MRLSNGPFPALTVRYARRFLFRYPDFGFAWLVLGEALIGFARYEEAEQAIAKAIEHLPPKALRFAYSKMGHLFAEAGDHAQAADWDRRAIAVEPDHDSGRIYLGRLLIKRGRLLDAEEVFRHATGCKKGCIDEAYVYLGCVLRALERYHDAADSFREAIRLDPEYREAKRALRDVEACIKWSGRRK